MNVQSIYAGSNGEATKALYARLQSLGAAGVVAMNLFRACKCSERAKLYRGGGYKRDAYQRKDWSIGLLCDQLMASAEILGIRWGWKEDPAQDFHNQVLYVDLPTGQVSFHAAERKKGPDYPGDWDQSKESAARIVKYVSAVHAEGFPAEERPENDSTFPLPEPQAMP
jgi:hypothetical protein